MCGRDRFDDAGGGQLLDDRFLDVLGPAPPVRGAADASDRVLGLAADCPVQDLHEDLRLRRRHTGVGDQAGAPGLAGPEDEDTVEDQLQHSRPSHGRLTFRGVDSGSALVIEEEQDQFRWERPAEDVMSMPSPSREGRPGIATSVTRLTGWTVHGHRTDGCKNGAVGHVGRRRRSASARSVLNAALRPFGDRRSTWCRRPSAAARARGRSARRPGCVERRILARPAVPLPIPLATHWAEQVAEAVPWAEGPLMLATCGTADPACTNRG